MPQALPIHHHSAQSFARWKDVLVLGCALALAVLLALAAPNHNDARFTDPESIALAPIGP